MNNINLLVIGFLIKLLSRKNVYKGGIRKFSVSGRRPTGNLPAIDEKKYFLMLYFFATDRIYYIWMAITRNATLRSDEHSI